MTFKAVSTHVQLMEKYPLGTLLVLSDRPKATDHSGYLEKGVTYEVVGYTNYGGELPGRLKVKIQGESKYFKNLCDYHFYEHYFDKANETEEDRIKQAFDDAVLILDGEIEILRNEAIQTIRTQLNLHHNIVVPK